MADPVEFVVNKLPCDLSSHGGLAWLGCLSKRINHARHGRPPVPGVGRRSTST